METEGEFFDVMPGLARPGHSSALRKSYAGKVRQSLKPGFGGSWPGSGRIGLNVAGRDKARAARLGASIGPDSRACVERAAAVRDEFQEFAPLLARRRFVPMLVDMIPTSSFGASLKNLLTDDCWKSLRKASFSPAGYVCEVCGEANGPVECHEVWSYVDGKGRDGWETQTLKDLLCLCADCHEMFHPGLAGLRGRGRTAAERLKAVNEWSETEWQTARAHMETVHRVRSKRRWKLDLSAVSGFGVLEISPAWKREGNTLSSRNSSGTSRTQIVGADCRHGGVMIANRPAQESRRPETAKEPASAISSITS